jgi:pyridoxamine 5'-phosphate oxidase
MPSWRQSLVKSLHKTRSIPESRYFQLATANSEGVPFCRTVVHRGLTDDNKLLVISDTRTDKFQQLSENNRCHVSWYFAKTREQYRFNCIASMATKCEEPELVKTQWEKLSDAGKKQFLWGRPGTPRQVESALNIEGDYSIVPAHFCVLSLNIENVDYLNLRGNPQHREWHEKDENDNWVSQSIIP